MQISICAFHQFKKIFGLNVYVCVCMLNMLRTYAVWCFLRGMKYMLNKTIDISFAPVKSYLTNSPITFTLAIINWNQNDYRFVQWEMSTQSNASDFFSKDISPGYFQFYEMHIISKHVHPVLMVYLLTWLIFVEYLLLIYHELCEYYIGKAWSYECDGILE